MNSPSVPPSAESRPSLPEPVRRPLDTRSVAAVLAAIRTDSERLPEQYLLDSVTPYGGE